MLIYKNDGVGMEKEAMSRHIYACLSKPVDEEELVFLIKSMI